MTDATQLICDAIAGMRRLRVRYHDTMRVLEPFLLGEYRDQRRFLLAWMVRCEEQPAKPSGWQHYIVTEMTDVELTSETFDGARGGYNPVSDERVSRTVAAVPALRIVR